jgi:hypothetical protein
MRPGGATLSDASSVPWARQLDDDRERFLEAYLTEEPTQLEIGTFVQAVGEYVDRVLDVEDPAVRHAPRRRTRPA